jgi:hypothetical protein
MLTPENAGCPHCFAPLKYQHAYYSGSAPAIIVNGSVSLGAPPQIHKFTCLACSRNYKGIHERNAHEMAAYYAAAQSKRKKKS